MSDQVGTPEDRFSRVTAQKCYPINGAYVFGSKQFIIMLLYNPAAGDGFEMTFTIPSPVPMVICKHIVYLHRFVYLIYCFTSQSTGTYFVFYVPVNVWSCRVVVSNLWNF